MDKAQAIQTVVDDLVARERLSTIRGNLTASGFSPEETHEIICTAIEQKRSARRESVGIGFRLEIVLMAIGLTILLIMGCASPPRMYFAIPNVMLFYGFYLWWIRPASKQR